MIFGSNAALSVRQKGSRLCHSKNCLNCPDG